jgi:hypothetical protein
MFRPVGHSRDIMSDRSNEPPRHALGAILLTGTVAFLIIWGLGWPA